MIDNFDNQGVKITPEDVSTLIDFFDKAETAYLESKLKDEFYANKLKTKKEANIDYTKVDLQLKNISRESTRVCKMIESAREGLKKK